MQILDAGIQDLVHDANVPVQLPADLTDVGALAQTVFNAVENHQYGLVASLAIIFVIVLLKKFTPDTSKVGAWMHSRIGTIVLNFTFAFSGAIATTFAAAQPFGLKTVLQALTVALTAAGGWAIFKNVQDDLAERKAQKAGLEAARSPEDTLNK